MASLSHDRPPEIAPCHNCGMSNERLNADAIILGWYVLHLEFMAVHSDPDMSVDDKVAMER